jgi:hypothetical protein
MAQRPWIDDFSAGYIRRMTPMLPKQGDRAPWIAHQNYTADTKALIESPVADDVLDFRRTPATV